MSKGITKTNAPMPDWLDNFAKEISQKKESTEPMSNDVSKRISEIINGISAPYSSVSEAVKDYQERIGLFEYRKKAIAEEIIAEAANELITEAAEDENEDKDREEKKNPEIIDKHPEIVNYIYNLVSSNYGIQIPAIINSILEVFGRHITESDLDDPDFIKFINKILMENPAPYSPTPSNLGKGVGISEDTYKTDNPLGVLQPNKQWR